ncbi:class I lanthipeptide [Chitinophaga sp. RAB17]|uniref:class I lanthipeptide n=1 Tax=Chitinophaga sp. RAB17 TaxID=3233049 RepID=UPI003F8E5667
MKKKQIDLSKKLMLTKEPIAQLNADQQFQLQGGAGATIGTICTVDTRQISSCRATSPGTGRPCCMIP